MTREQLLPSDALRMLVDAVEAAPKGIHTIYESPLELGGPCFYTTAYGIPEVADGGHKVYTEALENGPVTDNPMRCIIGQMLVHNEVVTDGWFLDHHGARFKASVGSLMSDPEFPFDVESRYTDLLCTRSMLSLVQEYQDDGADWGWCVAAALNVAIEIWFSPFRSLTVTAMDDVIQVAASTDWLVDLWQTSFGGEGIQVYGEHRTLDWGEVVASVESEKAVS